METTIGRHSVFQIVEVVGPGRLRDVRAGEWPYQCRDGRMLKKGYYVVSWRTAPETARFSDEAAFRGPFLGMRSAEEALNSIMVSHEA